MVIHNSESRPEFLAELRNLFLTEWATVDAFDDHQFEADWFGGNERQSNLPAPLLALESNNLVGGLSFTWFRPDDLTNAKLWINAILVKPAFRGNGIATSLIKEAIVSASKTDETELFVYTEIPLLYTSVGWQLVSCPDQNHVLKTSLVEQT